MKKRIFSIILITILLIAYTLPVCAAEPPGTGLPGTSLYDNLFLKNKININTENEETYYFFLGTEETYAQAGDVRVYPIYSDNSAYLSYEEKRIIGFFFLSSSELDGIGITRVQKDETGQYVKPINLSFSISKKLPDYKSLTTYESYWSSYLEQFGIDTDEEYTQFYEEYSGYYYGIYDLSTGYQKNSYLRESVNESGEMIIHPLNADGSKYDDTSISTLTSSRFNLSATGSHYYFPPFLFTDLMSDEDGDGNGNGSGSDDGSDSDDSTDSDKKFVCYKETVMYFVWDGLFSGQTYKNNFKWEVEKYPEYADAFIEMRACPLLQYRNKNEPVDWFYFCSPNSTYVKSVQKDMPNVPFTDGNVTGYQKTLLNYYYNWLERASHELSNTTVLKDAFVWEVRVVDSSGKSLSDWCIFMQNSSGTDLNMYENGQIVDDDGNVVSDRTDSSSYDPNLEDTGSYFDDSSFSSNNDQNVDQDSFWDKMSNFYNWTKQMCNLIVDFPNLLSKVYSWLPSELITAIAASISFVIIFRFLGR